MAQPILRTERLLLVPLADHHLGLEIELDSDAEVLRFVSGRSRTRAEVAGSHAERMSLGRKVDGLGYWIACLPNACASRRASPVDEDQGEFVGLMMLPPAHGPDQPDDPDVVDLGYRLVRRHWRRGLASEAARALLRHAFETVGSARVIAQTMSVNRGSRGVMERVGMRYVRTYHPVWGEPLSGADEGEVGYELTREMWEARRPAQRSGGSLVWREATRLV